MLRVTLSTAGDASKTQPGLDRVDAWRVDAENGGQRIEVVAAEVPVALVYNNRSFAVMLATPLDLEDFVRGFSTTEGIVGVPSDISAIEILPVSRGIEVRLTIAEEWANRLAARRRALAGRSGCGVCGVDSIAEALRPIERVGHDVRVTPGAIRRAVAAFPAGQALNNRVGSVHAAAFADLDGRILMTREDVGRHNALDKLVGALIADGTDRAAGFVIVSSRCSYEMVHKTAAAGIGLIAAVSAPTSLAIELAEKANVAVLGFAREERFTVYAGARRIDGED